MLPASLAQYGSISLLSWVFTAIGIFVCSHLFSPKLSQLLPKTGGHYVYCHEAFGDFVGFQVAYNYWLVLWIGNAAIVIALGWLFKYALARACKPIII